MADIERSLADSYLRSLQRYNVAYVIGWPHTQNDPCNMQ